MGTVTAFKDIGLPSSTRPRGISRQSFLVYLLDLRIRVTVAFLDFVTLSPLILRIRLGIKFLFVRLRFRYPFFSPAPRDTNLGSRFRVRRQLRPGGLSPQTDGMPVILKKQRCTSHASLLFLISFRCGYQALSSAARCASAVSMRIVWITTSSNGFEFSSTRTDAIALTTSMPSTTCPNTVCTPSSQGVPPTF